MYGVYVGGSATSNYITKNAICSNDEYGILVISDTTDNNYILTNNIWGTNQDYGIRINNGDRNTISSNYIHNNQIYGICLFGDAINNKVFLPICS